MPGFGLSAAETKTRTMPGNASTLARAAAAVGRGTFDLMGTRFGGKTALRLAAQAPERVHALVLEAHAAIRLEGTEPPAGTFFFSSRRRHTRCLSDWSSDVCSSDLERGYPD